MKKFFTLLVVCGLCLNMNAQALKNKIVLSIAPNTTDVQFTVKVDEGTNYSVDFGEGEATKLLKRLQKSLSRSNIPSPIRNQMHAK